LTDRPDGFIFIDFLSRANKKEIVKKDKRPEKQVAGCRRDGRRRQGIANP